MPDATSSSQAPPDASAPPKKKRSIFKNVPSWSAKEIPSPSSPSNRSPRKAGSSSNSNESPKNQRSPLAQDDNFFNRSIETLRRYEENESVPEPPKTDSTPVGEDLGVVDLSTANPDDAELRNHASPQKKRRLDGEHDNSIKATSATLGQNNADYDDAMDDIYSHPSDFRGASKSKPVEILEDNDDKEPQQSSPPKLKVAPITINLSDSENENNADTTKPKKPATSTASDSPVLPSVETEPPNGQGSPSQAEQTTSENPASNSIEQTPPRPTTLQPPAHDPVLAILITSQIPHTMPLLARRHFSQRLKEVREAWCNRNQLPQASADAVFLQWRGKRVFDLASCRALGMRVNELGEVWINGQCQPAGPDGSQIQMEAVNKAILDEREEEKQKERAQRELEAANEYLEFEASQPVAERGSEQAAEADKGGKIRVLLRSKDHDVYKVVVKRVTLVEKLINAFLKAYNISSDRSVSLFFEGDKLDPAQKLLDTDVQDRDFVDVYIK